MKKTPAYVKLYTALRSAITSGVYPYGSRLPSKRTYAADNGTSVITAEHAYELLEEEGYIEARERSGYFVIYKKDHFFADSADLPAPGPSASPEVPARVFSESSSASRTSFPFSMFARAMRKVITEYGERLLAKSEPFGTPELKNALASYLARSRGIRIAPEQLVIGAGAEYLYSLIVQMLGRNVIYALEDPSYEKIRKVYEANGAVCDMLKMGSGGIRSDELRRTDAGVLHVTPFHSYPSGITANASKRREYIEWARARQAMIIEDDYDSEFSLQSKAIDTLFSLAPEETVIYLNTFSRTIAPSMRLGYMILPAALVAQLREKIEFYSCTVSVFEQFVLAEFIESGEFERHINRIRRKLRKK